MSPFRPPSLINAEEVDVEKRVNAQAAPDGLEVQENQQVDSCVEGAEGTEASQRAKIKGRWNLPNSRLDAFINFASCIFFFFFPAQSKGRRELAGSDSKRSRSASPCEPEDFVLPPYEPNNPLGEMRPRCPTSDA